MIRLGAFDLLGHVIRLRSSPGLAGYLTEALADLACADRRRAPTLTVEAFRDGNWSVSWPDEQRYHGPESDVAFYDVFGALNEAAARHAARLGYVGLHGGAVRVGEAGVAVVGHSGAGKSTLTAGLVQAGHEFVADELSAVALRGSDHDDDSPAAMLHPYHRPIGLRSGGAEAVGLAIPDGPFGHTFPVRAPTIGAMGGATPLRLIAFVERDPLASPQVSDVTAATTLHRLSNHTLGTWGLERETFAKLDQLVRVVPAVTLRFGSTEDGVGLVEDAAQAASPV